MPSCSAYGCTAKDRAKGITFHRYINIQYYMSIIQQIPQRMMYAFTYIELRQKWITALRRDDYNDPHKSAVFCSRHFPESDMDKTSLSCVRVRHGAIPSIFEAFPSYLKKTKPVRKAPKIRISAKSIITTTSAINYDFSNTCASLLPMTGKLQAAPNSDESPRKVNLNRKLCKAERSLAFLRKKMKLLQQRKRKLAKRNASLKNVISDLEQNNVLEGESLYILQKSAGGIGDLL
ncbi:uncharacterized protein LOC136088050 [Hydra vulgaris]|uniref:Uncharacterized protein LOC136088050 n=1 Tax=Hydra vulgaris TaxID=6087 RepID=A0ABM4D0J9_HYDVU